jgi:GR25 family glycosyltransferase involved in LPS biosynthesis
MKASFTVFHKEGVDIKRDINVDRINNIMKESALKLQSPTIYISTLKELDEVLAKYKKIRFIKSEDKERIFPGTTGAAGLWISTYLAFKEFLLTDADTLFVFEDDITISTNFFKVVGAYASELPDDWDILSLLIPWDTIKGYSKSHDISNKEYICLMYQDWSTGGYMISRKGAETAIKDIEDNGISAPIDFYLYNYRYNNEIPKHKFNSFNIKPTRYAPVKLAPESSVSYIGAMEVYQA